MNAIVVDASVTLAWCFPDERTAMSISVLDRLKAGEQAVVPSFWSLEVLNVLLLGEKKGRMAPRQTKAFLEDLQAMNPVFDTASLQQVVEPVQMICRNHGLTPYDALYVELAMRLGYPLATQDQPQRQAAQALGVHCL